MAGDSAPKVNADSIDPGAESLLDDRRAGRDDLEGDPPPARGVPPNGRTARRWPAAGHLPPRASRTPPREMDHVRIAGIYSRRLGATRTSWRGWPDEAVRPCPEGTADRFHAPRPLLLGLTEKERPSPGAPAACLRPPPLRDRHPPVANRDRARPLAGGVPCPPRLVAPKPVFPPPGGPSVRPGAGNKRRAPAAACRATKPCRDARPSPSPRQMPGGSEPSAPRGAPVTGSGMRMSCRRTKTRKPISSPTPKAPRIRPAVRRQDAAGARKTPFLRSPLGASERRACAEAAREELGTGIRGVRRACPPPGSGLPPS